MAQTKKSISSSPTTHFSMNDLLDCPYLPPTTSPMEELLEKPYTPPIKTPLQLAIEACSPNKDIWEQEEYLTRINREYRREKYSEKWHRHGQPFKLMAGHPHHHLVLETFADSPELRLLAIEIGTRLDYHTTVGCDCCGNIVKAVLIRKN